MLVEGACTNGHALVCAVRQGRLRGAVTKGMLRNTCPRCGAEVVLEFDSDVLSVQSPASSRREAG